MDEPLIYARPGETKVQLVVSEEGNLRIYLLDPRRAVGLAQDLLKEALHVSQKADFRS